MSRNEELFARAQRTIPAGVNSPVRAFRSVGGTPRFLTRGEGAYVWDADGKRYIDYVGSWGPAIVGHAHPDVVRAVRETAVHGLSFGAPTEIEIEMAETLVRRLPSLEMVRLVSSGTEATMSALRLARGFTGRPKILKFEGCYHGHGDSLLVKAGSGALTFGQPSSAGVPPAIAGETVVVPYNDLDAVGAAFADAPDAIAAVIVEPIAGNMNLIMPKAGFLEGLRALCDRHGAVLIFDEVMTGFRVHPQGVQGIDGHQAGPDHAGQGDRRRHAGRRLRRPARDHGKDRAAGTGVSGREPCRAIRWRSRLDSPRLRQPRRPASTTGSPRRRAASPTVSSLPRSGAMWCSPRNRWAACSGSTSRRRCRTPTIR